MTDIPNAFGGFAPFPNTIMIPTMGLQSDVIGFRFGFGYEKGKRTLRAMSNEQFNNLDEEAEQAIYKRHDATAINFFEIEIQNWTNLQKIIIEKSVEIEFMKAKRTPSALREILGGFGEGLAEQEGGGIIPYKEIKDWFLKTFFNTETNNVSDTPPPAKQPVQSPHPSKHPQEPSSTESTKSISFTLWTNVVATGTTSIEKTFTGKLNLFNLRALLDSERKWQLALQQRLGAFGSGTPKHQRHKLEIQHANQDITRIMQAITRL